MKLDTPRFVVDPTNSGIFLDTITNHYGMVGNIRYLRDPKNQPFAAAAIFIDTVTGKGKMTFSICNKDDHFDKVAARSICLYRLNKGDYLEFSINSKPFSVLGEFNSNIAWDIFELHYIHGIPLCKNGQDCLEITKDNEEIGNLFRILCERYDQVFETKGCNK